MRDENAKPLLSRPICKLEMDKMDPQYVARVQWYLEHELQCSITYIREREKYLICFPEGTVEETYMGQSTQWTHRTTIRFPDGATLLKYVSSPLNSTQRAQTMLAFPNRILDGPEPPQQRKRRRAV